MAVRFGYGLQHRELLTAIVLTRLGQALMEKNDGEFAISGGAISASEDARTGGKDPESGVIL